MTGVGPATEPELELEFPPKPEYVRAVRLAVAALARLHDAPDDVVEDIRLAVSEACTSALPEPSADHRAEPLQVLAFSDDERMTVEVIGRGLALDRAVSGPPGEIESGDLPFERSLSLPLIRGLVDEVSVTPQGEDGGASIRMTVSLEGAGAA